ncbi:MAG: nuclear transport factor 2 family protein [Xanthobacteraceae bacterium]|nr:nuclear transport factor 2 family protein [Xanthobacteraceae bacterium]
MNVSLRERLNSLYAAFKLGKIDFVLNSFDDDIEFISYSPTEVFPFLGHHRGKAAMAEVLKSGYEEFEFISYEPVFMVCEAEDAAVVSFARFIHRRTGRSVSTMIAHFLRFRQGRVVELREFMDSFHAVKQLLGRELDLQIE